MASSSITDETEKRRFATLDEEAFKKLLTEKDSENTRKATNVAVNVLRSYLKEKGLCPDFEAMNANELDEMLATFYTEVRTANGELYKKSSLFSLRHGINRHLNLHSRNIDIIHGIEFQQSKLAFCAATKSLKREGKGGMIHYPSVEESDLQKMYSYFDLGNNVKLQKKVFLDIMMYFGRRGRENIHELKITDFAARTDADGKSHIYMATDEMTKNHQLDTNTAQGRMYSISDDPMCPVKSFIKYKRQLNQKCCRLFQRPSRGSTLKWYDNIPLGHNSIGNMMHNISVKAGLSIRYTNHSLRATVVHTLDTLGIPSRHIMSVTGHRAESSLNTYTGYTEPVIKRKMSDTISKSLRQGDSSAKKLCRDTVVDDLAPQPLSNSQYEGVLSELQDDGFDSILKMIDTNNMTTSSSSPASIGNNFNVERRTHGPLNLTLNNCSNITINYSNGCVTK